jgi:signal transduction histidine kinase
VSIKLNRIEENIVLLIHDDGIGISSDKINSFKFLGIFGMFERVKQSGGKMEMTSPDKGGVLIRVSIPME